MKKESVVVRAVTLPVGAPVGRSWEELDAALKDCFRLSTGLANWCVRRLFALDVPGEAKTPEAVTKWYGYGDAGENCPAWGEWAGAMASAQCVIRAVQRKYVQTRFDVMVRHVQSHLTYRFPQPFPVHNQNWKPSYADGGFPTVTLTLPGHGAFALRLKRRADFGRQLAMFRLLHDGAARRGEAAVYRNRKGDLLVKLVGEFPRVERGGADRVCFLHTDPAALLVAEVDGRSVTVTNADHVRRALARVKTMQARHAAFLARAGQDKKREVRMDRRQRRQLNGVVDERCAKQRDRVKDAVKQVAAQVARFCERQRVGLVAYDDTIRTFFPDGFPWHALKERLRQLLVGEMGCEWLDGTFHSLGTEERESWLRKARATLVTARRVAAHKSRPPRKSHPAVSTVPATCSGSAGRSSTTCSAATNGRRNSPAPSAAPAT